MSETYAFISTSCGELQKWSLVFPGKTTPRFKFICSIQAHNREINCIDTCPDDELVLTGSSDKLSKVIELKYNLNEINLFRYLMKFQIWSFSDLNLNGTCSGHNDTVSGGKFSPIDKVRFKFFWV